MDESSGRHYHPGVCHTCLAAAPSIPLAPPLLRCAQCQLPLYCSRKCQKKDWATHKDLCVVNKVIDGKNVFHRAKEAIAAGENWDKFREALQLTASINLKRPLTLAEKEMLSFPRVCAVCKDSKQDDLAECPICHAVFYCCSQHRDQDEDNHLKHCSNFLLLLECDRHEARNGLVQDLPFPPDVDATYCDLPDRLITLLKPQLQGVPCPRTVTLITERLSYPLSLMYALKSVTIGPSHQSLKNMKQLRVHVVGAISYAELLGIIRWEYLAHRLPMLEMLHITFVGPELLSCEDGGGIPDDHILDDSSMTMCDACRANGRKVVYEMVNSLYHDYVTRDYFRSPDVIVAYNCGFHEQSYNNPWTQTLPLMINDPDTPLVFTSYTETEAKLDLAAVRRAGNVKVELDSQSNPFKSLRPYREFYTDVNPPVFFWNNYITCVKADVQ